MCRRFKSGSRHRALFLGFVGFDLLKQRVTDLVNHLPTLLATGAPASRMEVHRPVRRSSGFDSESNPSRCSEVNALR